MRSKVENLHLEKGHLVVADLQNVVAVVASSYYQTGHAN